MQYFCRISLDENVLFSCCSVEYKDTTIAFLKNNKDINV